MGRKRKQQREGNLLNFVPERVAQWEETVEGHAVLLKPKFTNRVFVRYVLPRMKRPNFRVELDDFGTHVWNAIDGRHRLLEIADGLKERFGEEIEPVYERIGIFIRQLEQGGFIRYRGEEMEMP